MRSVRRACDPIRFAVVGAWGREQGVRIELLNQENEPLLMNNDRPSVTQFAGVGVGVGWERG